jgi:DNA polymerase-3 subunit epsilon
MDYGLIVDVETTGLNSSVHQIIEIGIIEFMLNSESGAAITRMYGALSDPGQPLSQEIERLTGIKTAHLANQKIDWQMVASMMQRAKIVIAHNADFDRSFLSQVAELQKIEAHWGCSIRHIDWKAKGSGSQALNYLAADHGFINPFPHRALFDCATTFRLIAPHLEELIENSHQKTFRVDAVNSPFEKKDTLKENGYRWDAARKIWYKIIFERQLATERDFLSKEIYSASQSQHRETLV